MAYLNSGNIKIVLKTANPKAKEDLSICISGLKELQIEQKINTHVRLAFKAVIGFGMDNTGNDPRERYIRLLQKKTIVTVTTGDLQGTKATSADNSRDLFSGIVTKFEINFEKTKLNDKGGKLIEKTECVLAVEALSHTYELDISEKNQTWQNCKKTVQALFDQMLKPYANLKIACDFQPEKLAKGNLKRFYLQYRETDWIFFQRLASVINNTGLVADPVQARFQVGVVPADNKKLEACKGLMQTHVANSLVTRRYPNKEIGYRFLKTDQIFKIGDQVRDNGNDWVICQVNIELEKDVLVYKYIFTTVAGLRQTQKVNNQIAGLTLHGLVLGVARDKLRVHFDIDGGRNEEKDCYFPYVTPYSAEDGTGWYCMPEPNDQIQVYFPTANEREGVALTSLRNKATPKNSDPKVKYFRTNKAKELKFSQEDILITAKNDGQGQVIIWLNEKKGIVVYGQKALRLHALNNVEIKTKKDLEVNAGVKMSIAAGNGKLDFDEHLHIDHQKILKN